MARFFCLLLLLFFFSFSSARDSLHLPQTEDPLPTIDTDEAVSDSDSNPTILLPSQKPISDLQPIHNLDASDEVDPQSVPLKTVSFRPINRHFPWRPFPFSSHRGRPCHHRHDHRLNPLGPRFRPFGDDMKVSDEDLSFHQVTGRDRHSEPRFEHGNDLEMSEVMMKPGHPYFHPHPHHHHHRHHEHGFLAKIRHFFFH